MSGLYRKILDPGHSYWTKLASSNALWLRDNIFRYRPHKRLVYDLLPTSSYLLGHCKSTTIFELTVQLPLESPWRWEVPSVKHRSIAKGLFVSFDSIFACHLWMKKDNNNEWEERNKGIRIVLTERVEKRIFLWWYHNR